MNITDFKLSKHAIERALDMGIDAEMIRECLLRPEDSKRSAKYPGCTNYRFGRITCAVDKSRVVITVLWTREEDWEADLVGIGSYEGREYRGTTIAPSEAGATQ